MAAEPTLSFDDPIFAMHRDGKIGIHPTVERGRPRRAGHGLHAGRRPGVQRHRGATRTRERLHLGRQHRGRRERRHRGARPWRYRPGRGHAGDGGQGAAVQALRRHQRRARVHRLHRCGRAWSGRSPRWRPSFGGINLEDISAPRCFEIEDRLRAMLDIPVFHDDQHGTAIVTLAALRSAARVVGKELGDLRVVVCGAGASGIAVSKILLSAGVGDIAVADSKGLIYQGRDGLNPVKAALAAVTNSGGLTGSPESALRGADVFIGLSGSSLPEEAIASDGAGSDRVPAVQPGPGDPPGPWPAGMPPWWRPAGATSRTRSTTRSRSPACSGRARCRGRPAVTESMKLAAADAISRARRRRRVGRIHHSEPVRRASGARGRRRGRRAGPRRRGRPPLVPSPLGTALYGS